MNIQMYISFRYLRIRKHIQITAVLQKGKQKTKRTK